MKRLLIFLGAVILIVISADILAGMWARRYIQNNRLPGDCASIDYILKDADEDLIVMGNSLVLNSLIPQVLSDSLDMSAYNGASNGQQLPFFHSLLSGMFARHKPKAVILGMSHYTLGQEGVGDRFGILAPYYGSGYNTLDSYFEQSSAEAPWLMKSTFYRFNSIWWRILLYHIKDNRKDDSRGFVAKDIPRYKPSLDTIPEPYRTNPFQTAILDSINSLCRANNVRLVILLPPLYEHEPWVSPAEKYLTDYCRRESIPIIDDTDDPYFRSRPELFFDHHHLNIEGARIYSASVASRLRPVLAPATDS